MLACQSGAGCRSQAKCSYGFIECVLANTAAESCWRHKNVFRACHNTTDLVMVYATPENLFTVVMSVCPSLITGAQAETFLEVSLSGLQLPSRGPPHTELLDLDPLPLEALGKEEYVRLYRGRFTHFNPIQTQVGWLGVDGASCSGSASKLCGGTRD